MIKAFFSKKDIGCGTAILLLLFITLNYLYENQEMKTSCTFQGVLQTEVDQNEWEESDVYRTKKELGENKDELLFYYYSPEEQQTATKARFAEYIKQNEEVGELMGELFPADYSYQYVVRRDYSFHRLVTKDKNIYLCHLLK